jgi:hypothetical protein
VNLAARGSRKTGNEVEKIEDEAVLTQVKQQARKVHMMALLTAVILTFIALLPPPLQG